MTPVGLVDEGLVTVAAARVRTLHRGGHLLLLVLVVLVGLVGLVARGQPLLVNLVVAEPSGHWR